MATATRKNPKPQWLNTVNIYFSHHTSNVDALLPLLHLVALTASRASWKGFPYPRQLTGLDEKRGECRCVWGIWRWWTSIPPAFHPPQLHLMVTPSCKGGSKCGFYSEHSRKNELVNIRPALSQMPTPSLSFSFPLYSFLPSQSLLSSGCFGEVFTVSSVSLRYLNDLGTRTSILGNLTQWWADGLDGISDTITFLNV